MLVLYFLYFTCSKAAQLCWKKVSHTIALVLSRYNSECTKLSWKNMDYKKKQQSRQQKLNDFCAGQCSGISCSSVHGKPEVSNRRPEGYHLY